MQPSKPTNDAEAICEAVTRSGMRFVPVKTEEHTAILLHHHTRDLLVRPMTQVVNAIRSHLAEFGIVGPVGVRSVDRLPEAAAQLQAQADVAVYLLGRQFHETRTRVAGITRKIETAQRQDATTRRLTTIPRVGVRTASAITATTATTPHVSQIHSARDDAAWVGLKPRQHSSGGRERMDRISRMGDRCIRWLLCLGALARIRTRRRLGEGDDRIWRMLERKPAKVVAIDLRTRWPERSGRC